MVGDPVRKADADGDAPFLQGALISFSIPTAANKHPEIPRVIEDDGECLGKVLDAFIHA